MSGTDDLKNLLARLKDEVGPLPPEPVREPAAARQVQREAPRSQMQAQIQSQPQGVKNERFTRAYRREPTRGGFSESGGPNVIWSENKETMLFGVLASLIAALGGILAGLDYLVWIGAVVFMLFSFMMFLALFGYYLNFRRRGPSETGLAERVDALSRKVEMLSGRAVSGGSASYQSPGQERERELEHRVEELRVLVKSLAKSVEQRNG